MSTGEGNLKHYVRSKALEIEAAIHSTTKSNGPNWKENARNYAKQIEALEFVGGVGTYVGDFVSGISEVFNLPRSDVFHAIQDNTPIDKFPMTCIKNFSEAHRVLFSGQNSYYLDVLNRVYSYLKDYDA